MGWYTKFKEGKQKFFSLLSPYLSSENRKEHIMIVSAFAATHLVEVGINSYFVYEAQSENVDESIARSIGTNFGNIIFNGLMYGFKIAMSNYLAHSINKALLKANGIEGWLENKASIGVDFMNTTQQGAAFALSPDSPVERILGEYLKSFSKGTVKLTVENISRLISSAVGLAVIGQLSNAKTAAFYLAVGGGLILVCCKIDKERIDMSLKVSEYDDTINARLTHIRERAAQVLALQGEEREAKLINDLMKKKQKLASRIFRYEVRNNSILYVTFFGVAPLLSTLADYAPSVLAPPPSNPVAALLFQQHVFQLLINFFITMENYTQEYPKFGSHLNKTYSLQMLLALWRQTRMGNDLLQDFPEDGHNRTELFLENVNVNMPTRNQDNAFKELIKGATISFEPGEYRLEGASNAGKSTTFKALMGLWPHASGKIIYPCKKNQIRFIPQETFIPYDPTLLEMIIYPHDNSPFINRDEILFLLKELNLSHLIPTLDEKSNLKMLSRGEQQRLAIISALIARPKILLMDEATASIDENNKRIVEQLIRRYLPSSLIIIIDHSPLVTPSPINNQEKETPITCEPTDEKSHVSIKIDAPQRNESYVPSYATHFQPPKRLIINSSKQLELIADENETNLLLV